MTTTPDATTDRNKVFTVPMTADMVRISHLSAARSSPGTSFPPSVSAVASSCWLDPSLATGTSVTYAITFNVDAGIHATATLGGVAEGDGTDPNPANNAAIITIQLG